MRRLLKRRRHDMPTLNTQALPDLIFTVLFFFMIVTHMRTTEPKVAYSVPQGRELQKLGRKSAVVYIYIGKALPAATGRKEAQQAADGTAEPYLIQLNNRLASIDDIRQFIANERERMSAEDRARMTVSLRADRDVPMGVIADVKQALQESMALRISYSATERDSR